MTWTGSECQEIMSNLNLDLVLTIQPTQRVDITFIWKVCLPVCKDTLLKWHLLCFRQVKENWSRPVICEISKLLPWVSENSHEKTQSSLPGDAKCLQLWYYMEGQGTWTLNVYQQFSDKDRPLLVTQSGEQGGLWRFAQTPLTVSGSSYRVSPWISTQVVWLLITMSSTYCTDNCKWWPPGYMQLLSLVCTAVTDHKLHKYVH